VEKVPLVVDREKGNSGLPLQTLKRKQLPVGSWLEGQDTVGWIIAIRHGFSVVRCEDNQQELFQVKNTVKHGKKRIVRKRT
jgi:hypothetical protein